MQTYFKAERTIKKGEKMKMNKGQTLMEYMLIVALLTIVGLVLGLIYVGFHFLSKLW